MTEFDERVALIDLYNFAQAYPGVSDDFKKFCVEVIVCLGNKQIPRLEEQYYIKFIEDPKHGQANATVLTGINFTMNFLKTLKF